MDRLQSGLNAIYKPRGKGQIAVSVLVNLVAATALATLYRTIRGQSTIGTIKGVVQGTAPLSSFFKGFGGQVGTAFAVSLAAQKMIHDFNRDCGGVGEGVVVKDTEKAEKAKETEKPKETEKAEETKETDSDSESL